MDTPDTKKLVETGLQLVITLVLSSVSIALVFLATYLFIFPIPATQGYLNFGDVLIFTMALAFGPVVGGIGGGVGSSLSDVFGGFSTFAPFTLIIKGLEGLVAGFIADRRFRGSPFLAWLVAGSIMVGGYFLTESIFIALLFGASGTTGVVAALSEVPFNVLQVFAGGLVGVPVSRVLRREFRSYLFPTFAKRPSVAEKKG